jgi:hypothetical protein
VSFAPSFGSMLLVLAIAAVPGCTGAQATGPDAGPMTSGIIVKFRDPAFDPARGDYLATLSGDFGVTLGYVRLMSGGAHVLRISGAGATRESMRVVERLRGRTEVLYAEPDRSLRALGEK